MKTMIWILPVILLTGCAGGRCLVTARTIDPPVSFTACVLDSSGRIRRARQDEIVSHFVLNKHNWSMFYKLAPLGAKEWDISQELSAKIQQAGGNAAVNVTVHAEGANMLVWYFAALVPIIPSYVDVTVQGDIVRFRARVESGPGGVFSFRIVPGFDLSLGCNPSPVIPAV